MINLRIWLTFDWDDQLGHDGEDFGAASLNHIENALHREETVRILLLPDSFEKDWQVMVIVQLGNVDLPVDTVVSRAVDRRNWQISPIVETAEICRGHGFGTKCT